MRYTKLVFFGYLATVALIVGFIAVSFSAAPQRNPDTLYLTYGGSVKTLDPAEVNDTVGAAFVGQIYECLYNYKYGVAALRTLPRARGRHAARQPRRADDDHQAPRGHPVL